MDSGRENSSRYRTHLLGFHSFNLPGSAKSLDADNKLSYMRGEMQALFKDSSVFLIKPEA